MKTFYDSIGVLTWKRKRFINSLLDKKIAVFSFFKK